MTSALLQQPTQTTATTAALGVVGAATTFSAMAWSNEKLRLTCVDNIGLRQLWKLIALDTKKLSSSKSRSKSNNNILEQQQQQQQQHEQQLLQLNNNNNNEKLSLENCENLADYLTNRDILQPSHMSLLKFLAINALELSAPATPVLLQQKHANSTPVINNVKPKIWVQLSGHPESIVPTNSGIVRKRIASISDSEVLSYQQISSESATAKIVPHFYGTLQLNGELFIELQDLLADFKDPCVMDIKMGCRTFLESEVTNQTLRPDLYKKMITVDATAPTAEEHQAQAITKLRYMLFREAMSSSHTKGFRIEALRMRGRSPQKDLKTVRSNEQIGETITQFVQVAKRTQVEELVQRLRHMRSTIEQSAFFAQHEIVGSSIFIVYDETKVGAWLIDFVKSRKLPEDVRVNHRSDWLPGNREEGLLKGMDELIQAFEHVHEMQDGGESNGRKCLQI